MVMATDMEEYGALEGEDESEGAVDEFDLPNSEGSLRNKPRPVKRVGRATPRVRTKVPRVPQRRSRRVLRRKVSRSPRIGSGTRRWSARRGSTGWESTTSRSWSARRARRTSSDVRGAWRSGGLCTGGWRRWNGSSLPCSSSTATVRAPRLPAPTRRGSTGTWRETGARGPWLRLDGHSISGKFRKGRKEKKKCHKQRAQETWRRPRGR